MGCEKDHLKKQYCKNTGDEDATTGIKIRYKDNGDIKQEVEEGIMVDNEQVKEIQNNGCC
jgi:hypothetical protein